MAAINQEQLALRNSLRRMFRERRNSLRRADQEQAASDLITRCREANLFDNCHAVALYTTHDGELNTGPLIEYLWQQNIQVYLPVVHPFSRGNLLFLRYSPSSSMQPNRYGILEPVLDVTQVIPPKQLDILFTPLVAFDLAGNRLGMGGGFYDRTLAALLDCAGQTSPETRPVKVIGLAHECQKTETLPTASWDIPIPLVLSPERLYQF